MMQSASEFGSARFYLTLRQTRGFQLETNQLYLESSRRCEKLAMKTPSRDTASISAVQLASVLLGWTGYRSFFLPLSSTELIG